MNYRASIAVALITTLLLISSGNALADDWRELHDFGNRKLFLKFPSPKYTDKPIRIWSLISFKIPQQTNGITWSSWVHLEEFNCKGENITSRQITFYSKSMGMGHPVQEMPDNETSAVQPGTMGETVFQLVCQH